MLTKLSQNPKDTAFVQHPYRFYAKAHAAGSAFWWNDYDWPVACGYGLVNAMLRDRRLGRPNPNATERPAHLAPFYAVDDLSLLELEGEAHSRLRRLITKVFTNRSIAAMAPFVEQLAHQLIDEMQSGDDLLTKFCEPIPVLTIAKMLNVPVERAPDLLRWSHEMVAMYQFGRTRAVEDRAVAATQAFSAYLHDLIAERRRAPGKDLLSALIAEGDLSESEIIATIILVLNAGHEASVHAFGNGIHAILLANGDTKEWMAAENIEGTVEEILRFDPPLHMFTRYAYEDVEIGPLSLKRGEIVGLCLGAAAHDPSKFDMPEVFNPLRYDPGHISFGAGAHFCLGAVLARTELRTALPILFDRLPNLKLAIQSTYADRYHFRGLTALNVEC
ncbi:MAG: cytochrome P450 [Pikeienuella sp.]